jgi:hypothetical protein
MAGNSPQNIPKDKFLLIAVNLLHRQFVSAGRTQAKRVYRDLEEGRVLPITTVKMEDESTVRFSVSLDHSEFRGKLNFSAFRASLSILISNLARAVQEKQNIPVFSVENNPDSVLFGITGITIEQEQANVLLLGTNVQGGAGAVTLRLMYFDPEQFINRRGETRVTA